MDPTLRKVQLKTVRSAKNSEVADRVHVPSHWPENGFMPFAALLQ